MKSYRVRHKRREIRAISPFEVDQTYYLSTTRVCSLFLKHLVSFSLFPKTKLHRDRSGKVSFCEERNRGELVDIN